MMTMKTHIHPCLLALLLLGCSHATAPSTMTKVSGDGQVGVPGEELTQPLVVRIADAHGNPVAGVSIAWSVLEGGGAISTLTSTTGADGLASAVVRLGSTAANNRFQAGTQNWAVYTVVFAATHTPFTLDYSEPLPGGKLRLVKNPASTGTSMTLDLMVAPGAGVSAYSVGFNLPLDASKVTLDSTTPLVPGTALNPGSNPPAAMATLPQTGPLKNTLVTGQSQKASGEGAVTTDTTLPGGTLLYSIKLKVRGDATPGVVFDGTPKSFSLASAGARTREGTTVVNANEVVVGKLIVK